MVKIAERLKLSIKGKLLLYILSSATIVYVASFGYLSIHSINSSAESAKQLALSNSADYAKQIKGELDGIFAITRTLANVGATFHQLEWEKFSPIFLETQKNIIENNKGFLSTATSWELRFIDATYKHDYGRYLSGYFRKNGTVTYFDAYRNMEGDDINSSYYQLKTTKKEWLSNPEYYSYSGKSGDNVLNTNFSTPVVYNNEFVGVVGVDVDLGYFQDICDNLSSFEHGYAFILSNDGSWVAAPNESYYGKKITETNKMFAAEHKIVDKIKSGTPFTVVAKDTLDNERFYAFSPIVSIGDDRPWAFCVAVPMDVVLAPAKSMMKFSILIGVIGFILMTIIIYLISFSISRPIKQTTQLIKKLALGQIEFKKDLDTKRRDEIGDMERSIETLSNGLLNALNFAKEIGSGNLNAQYDKLSEHDTLGQALLEMRESLQKADEELARKQEEEKIQIWSTENHARLIEIIRDTSRSIKNMGYEVVRFIINQIGACQGALYMLNDNDSNDIYYELISAVAYGRDKLLHAKIKPEEGLVGRCAFEKMTVILTDIPDNYINISSGLGDSNPNCIALFPLINDDVVLGVLEVISFNKLKPHEITFIEKSSEGIASTINSIKISHRTDTLLHQLQEQTEMLTQQEEEMRQNIEEMRATQEESKKREDSTRKLIDAINTVSMVALYDMDGTLIDINQKFCDMLGVPRENLLGKKQGSFATKKQTSKLFDSLWLDLRNGKTRQIIQEIEINGRTMWITELYTPVLNSYGEPDKVYNISIDITKSKTDT
ncbi:MAG TPA: GAF domain-containing protein [Salinivirgaceae bacterium]|nr:GAF domain-containing protein [Salinivirgaceae bacterium]HQA75608.1 GAF domain-containing protein [Salinivirgaceae bacterium]